MGTGGEGSASRRAGTEPITVVFLSSPLLPLSLTLSAVYGPSLITVRLQSQPRLKRPSFPSIVQKKSAFGINWGRSEQGSCVSSQTLIPPPKKKKKKAPSFPQPSFKVPRKKLLPSIFSNDPVENYFWLCEARHMHFKPSPTGCHSNVPSPPTPVGR